MYISVYINAIDKLYSCMVQAVVGGFLWAVPVGLLCFCGSFRGHAAANAIYGGRLRRF